MSDVWIYGGTPVIPVISALSVLSVGHGSYTEILQW